jgi:hypothetical protein
VTKCQTLKTPETPWDSLKIIEANIHHARPSGTSNFDVQVPAI